MKILLLASGDGKSGACIVARALGSGLREKGHDVTFLASRVDRPEEWIQPCEPGSTWGGDVAHKILFRTGLNQLRLNHRLPFSMGKEYFRQFDLIHVHDLPSGFNHFGLSWLSRIRPMVWTLHSMTPLTGGCLFALDCDKYLKACGQCPQFGKWPLEHQHRDASRAVLRLKRANYRRTKVHVVGPSQWIVDCARVAFARQQRTLIPNAADPVFGPVEDRAALRARLGIPEDAFAIMFAVGGKVEDRRKGLDIIQAALAKLPADRVFLIPTGITPPQGEMGQQLARFPGLPPQYVASREDMRDLYAAADVVWSPTRADKCPMVLLEALSCGTPAVGTMVGGIPEVLNGGKAGVLIPPEDPQALAEATQSLMQDRDRLQQLGQAGREWVESEYSRELFLSRYEALYQRLLAAG